MSEPTVADSERRDQDTQRNRHARVAYAHHKNNTLFSRAMRNKLVKRAPESLKRSIMLPFLELTLKDAVTGLGSIMEIRMIGSQN
jgi:hypothetical protein